MSENNLVAISQVLTKEEATKLHSFDGVNVMSSLRIAEVTGKEHFNVTADILRICKNIKIDTLRFEGIYLDTMNREQTHYLLPEREFMLIISSYSDKYRFQLIDELLGDGNLVTLNKNNEVFTTSLEIARRFPNSKGKKREHKDVLRAIENKIKYLDEIGLKDEYITQRKITPRDYIDERGKKQPMYLLDRDAFSLIVMGFTGKEALLWQHNFIQAFNQMEQMIVDSLKSNIEKIEACQGFKELSKVTNNYKTEKVGGYARTPRSKDRRKLEKLLLDAKKELEKLELKDNDYWTLWGRENISILSEAISECKSKIQIFEMQLTPKD